ncbi:MAG: hypothetical protein ACKOUT_08145 [Novosphingobium sp.]
MTDRLARLSADALKFATSCGFDDPGSTSRRLYRFNNIPASSYWRSRLDRPEDARQFLALHGTVSWANAFRTHIDDSAHWWHWSRIGANKPKDGRTFKLYVSCLPSDLPDALHTVGHSLIRSDAFGFKVGHDAIGVLRSDKLVIYFMDREAMESAARSLTQSLSGISVQGVPFTSQLEPAGLISAGIDPPSPPEGSKKMSYSWRSWLTATLGQWLEQESKDGSTDPVAAALSRLSTFGVNTQTWAVQAEALTQ